MTHVQLITLGWAMLIVCAIALVGGLAYWYFDGGVD